MHYTPTKWTPATRSNPCPICGKGRRCAISDDGTVAKCCYVDEGAFKTSADDVGPAYFHRLTEPIATPPRRPAAPPCDWTADHRRYAEAMTPEQYDGLSLDLSVTVESLRRVGYGWSTEHHAYCTAERNAKGTVIGIALRGLDGGKWFARGGHRGLTIPADLDLHADVLLIVEGASDVAACLTLGVEAVGRPSNVGGVDHLRDLLRDDHGDLYVIGERDEKPDGRWPGREGAERTAKRLADELGRPVRWAMPPHGAKDIRGWLAEHDAHETDALREVLA